MTKQTKTVPKYLRILIPGLLILVWFVAGGIGGPYFGRIDEVASNDQTTFLPASAESTQVTKELKKFQDETSIPSILVFNEEGTQLSSESLAVIGEATQSLSDIEGVSGQISPPIVSEDGEAALVLVNMESGTEYREFVAEIRTTLDEAELSSEYYVSGPVGFLNDLGEAFAGIDGLLLVVALAVVCIILLLVYRSPILPFIVLINSLFALCAAILVVFYLAQAGLIALNGQVQGILFILVIGAATDYALLFVSRYREELTRHKEVHKAIIASWKRSLEPIVAAGGTVIAGLLCLLLSDLSSNKALGPVGAIGIALAIVATLTFLPSLLMLFGRVAFWPRKPKVAETSVATIESKGLWPAIARFLKRRSRIIWIASTAVLVVMSLGIVQLKADGVAQSDLILGSSDARNGQSVIDAHFPGGSGTPVQIIAPSEDLEAITESLTEIEGVASISVRADNSPSGSLPLTGDQTQVPIFAAATPKVVDGEVLIEATLQDAADSKEAEETIITMRETLHAIDQSILVGGVSATQLDTKTSAEHDRAVVIPAVLVVITVILMLLLRSILAPIILLITTVLSFTATLGISALIFNNILGLPGADPSVVLYGFIFLVALGIDYNIFLMTRVREESLRVGTRRGVLIGLIVTGSVITSAGIVLAATFAALAVIPILFLLQLAFIVAFGVLLDTTVVRSLLVPAIIYELDNKSWWPAQISSTKTSSTDKPRA